VVAENYREAIDMVPHNGALFVFGSLYLASGIRGLLKDTYK